MLLSVQKAIAKTKFNNPNFLFVIFHLYLAISYFFLESFMKMIWLLVGKIKHYRFLSISIVQMAVWINFVRCGYFKNKCGDPTFWCDYCNRYKVSFHQKNYFENGMTFTYEEWASLR